MCVFVYNRRTQHRTVLIIFPLNLQTIITALMLSVGGEGSKKESCVLYASSPNTITNGSIFFCKITKTFNINT